jgi:hypothetical protein
LRWSTIMIDDIAIIHSGIVSAGTAAQPYDGSGRHRLFFGEVWMLFRRVKLLILSGHADRG